MAGNAADVQPHQDNVRLDARLAAKTGQTLAVEYRLSNLGTEAIFVLDNLLNRNDPRMGPDVTRSYTLLSGAGELVLFRGLLPVPEGLQVESPEVPYAQPLAAGQTVTRSFEFPAKLRSDHPYDDVSKAEVIEIRSLSLSVGFVAASLVEGLGQDVERAGQMFRRFSYRELIGHQMTVSTGLGPVDMQLVRWP